jgi:hypothetical protein
MFVSVALLWPLWLRIRRAPDTRVLLGLIALTAQLQLRITPVVEMAQPDTFMPCGRSYGSS